MTGGQRLLELFLQRLEKSDSRDGNLFHVFAAAAAEAASHQHTNRLRKLAESLKLVDPQKAFLGRPSFAVESASDRLIWMPLGMPDKKRIGFVSSRLGHSPDDFPIWFDTLRTVCARLDLDAEAVVCTRDTAGFEFIQRCSFLFGCDRIELLVADSHALFDDWLLHLEVNGDGQHESGCYPLYISPGFADTVPRLQELVYGQSSMRRADEFCDVQTRSRDWWHCQLCEVIYALYVAKNGNTLRALSERNQHASCSSNAPATIFLPVKGGLMDETAREKLVAQGAWLHYLYELESGDDELSNESEKKSTADRVQAVAVRNHTENFQRSSIQWYAAEQPTKWAYLTHCTRRRAGPWPDEDRATYLDDLIFRRVGANHSALAALCRILRTRKLVATAEFVRGESRVVSFSEKTLPDLLAQRVFRPHLARWDFEPYGVCIDRDVISQFGGRPVIYGTDSDFEQLAADDRPYFQKSSPPGPVSPDEVVKPGIDWSIEQEWRLMGDLLLSRIPPEKAFVFVPTWVEAEFVAPFSRFPIRVIGEFRVAEIPRK